MLIRIFLPSIFVLLIYSANGQELWSLRGGIPTALSKTTINCWCPDCSEFEIIGPAALDLDQGCTVTPNGNLFAMDDYNRIYQVDTAAGAPTLILYLPHDNDNECVHLDVL